MSERRDRIWARIDAEQRSRRRLHRRIWRWLTGASKPEPITLEPRSYITLIPGRWYWSMGPRLMIDSDTGLCADVYGVETTISLYAFLRVEAEPLDRYQRTQMERGYWSTKLAAKFDEIRRQYDLPEFSL